MGVPVKFFRGTTLPSTLYGGGLYMIANKGIYCAQGTADSYYSSNSVDCYANYITQLRVFPNSYASGAEIEVILFRSGSTWSGSQYKSVGFRAAANSGDSSTCFGTPQLVVGPSSSLVLACYTSFGWVLATSPTTSVSAYGYVEIRKLQLVWMRNIQYFVKSVVVSPSE